MSSRQWVCVSEASSIEPPAGGVAAVVVDGADVALPLITYKQFVDDAHPYKSLQSADSGSVEQLKAFNKCVGREKGEGGARVFRVGEGMKEGLTTDWGHPLERPRSSAQRSSRHSQVATGLAAAYAGRLTTS